MADDNKPVAKPENRLAQPESPPAPLTRRERILAAIAGGVFSVAGIVAIVVVGKDGAGSLALVAVGALFLLVSVAEIIPTGFKLGSNEVTVRRRTAAEDQALHQIKEAQDKIAEGDAEGAMRTLESVATPTQPDRALTPRSANFISARSEVLTFVYGWAQRNGAQYVSRDDTPYGMYVVRGDKRVAIDLQYLVSCSES